MHVQAIALAITNINTLNKQPQANFEIKFIKVKYVDFFSEYTDLNELCPFAERKNKQSQKSGAFWSTLSTYKYYL